MDNVIIEKGSCSFQNISSGIFFAHEQYTIYENEDNLQIISNVVNFGQQGLSQNFKYIIGKTQMPKLLNVKISNKDVVSEINFNFNKYNIEIKQFNNGNIEFENLIEFSSKKLIYLFQGAFVVPFYSLWRLDNINFSSDTFQTVPFGELKIKEINAEGNAIKDYKNVILNIVALDVTDEIILTYRHNSLIECKFINQDILIKITNET